MSTKEKNADGYVRITTTELLSVRLTHLISEKDLTILVPGDEDGTTITGITEWVGAHRNMPLSVGWDWGILQQTIVLLSPNEIRTNIQIVSADGRPELPAIAKVRLLHWIETLPWREAIEELLRRDDSDEGLG